MARAPRNGRPPRPGRGRPDCPDSTTRSRPRQPGARAIEHRDVPGGLAPTRGPDGEVGVPVTVDVGSGKGESEPDGSGIRRCPGQAPIQGDGPGSGQAIGPTAEDLDDAGLFDVTDIFAGHADGEVHVPVAIEVGCREGLAEVVVVLRRSGQAILRPQLVALGRQAATRPVQDVDRADPELVRGQAVAITPIARSACPSRSKSPEASAAPKRSLPTSGHPWLTPFTPGESWLRAGRHPRSGPTLIRG